MLNSAPPLKKPLRTIRSAYRPFLRYVKPDWILMALDYLTILIAVITNTAMIWLIGKPFTLLQQSRYDEVVTTLCIFAAVVLVNQIAQLGGGLLTNYIGFRTIGRIRNAILERSLILSFPVINKLSSGDVLARLNTDVDKVKAVVFDALVFISSHILTLSIYVFMLFWIDITLALWSLAIAPFYIIHQRIFAPSKRHAVENFLKSNGELLSFEERALANTRGISNYTAETYIARLHKTVFEKARFWINRERNIDVYFGVSFSFMIYITGLVIILLGIDGVRENRFSIGQLVSFLLYLGYLTVPTRGIADIVFQSLGSIAAAQRIQHIFQSPLPVSELPDARELHISHGQITLQQVSFAYGDNPSLFNGLSLHINGGETLAIVGPSGSGKTTLSNLLARYFDPIQGSISIDGQNLRDVTLSSLRRHITIVSQEPFLLRDTIRANLVMVKPDANEAQIVEACKNSFAWEFIEKLPKGLDNVIGVGGNDLSTGQKQRLSLAQAFLRDTPILILDEATSALDSHSEQMVIQAIQRLRQSRTTLIIAHRYSSIKNADRVVYFNGDGTVTTGRHMELMQSHGGYRDAVEWQISTHKTLNTQ